MNRKAILHDEIIFSFFTVINLFIIVKTMSQCHFHLEIAFLSIHFHIFIVIIHSFFMTAMFLSPSSLLLTLHLHFLSLFPSLSLYFIRYHVINTCP